MLNVHISIAAIIINALLISAQRFKVIEWVGYGIDCV